MRVGVLASRFYDLCRMVQVCVLAMLGPDLPNQLQEQFRRACAGLLYQVLWVCMQRLVWPALTFICPSTALPLIFHCAVLRR
jgi:hypothetical protein